MRNISCKTITETVKKLAIRANTVPDAKVMNAIRESLASEESPVGRTILNDLLKNGQLAAENAMPICQDTGLAVVFIKMGQEVHIVDGDLTEAVNAGVSKAYIDGYLRKSVVRDPIDRVNTKDNTPAIIHFELVPGDEFSITVAPKGIGSENMSRIFMLKPAQGLDGIREAILTTVEQAGASACPPLVIGVGIGGNFEKCAMLAKKALLRPIGEHSKDPAWAAREAEWLNDVNDLGIGPQGLGGRTTALWLAVETYPAHIGGMPVAVNLNCHVARHESASL